jgi:hypothetical protein
VPRPCHPGVASQPSNKSLLLIDGKRRRSEAILDSGSNQTTIINCYLSFPGLTRESSHNELTFIVLSLKNQNISTLLRQSSKAPSFGYPKEAKECVTASHLRVCLLNKDGCCGILFEKSFFIFLVT